MIGRLTILSVAIAVLAPASAATQLTPSPGDRVRVSQVDGGVRTGELRRSSSAELEIFDDEVNRVLLIPAAEVAGLERSLGKHRSFGKTFWATFGIGAGVGLIGVGPFIPVCESIGPCSPGSRGAAMVQGMALGALVAIPIGLVRGVTRRTERWAPASVPSGSSEWSLVGAPDGSIGLRFTFPMGGGY